MTGRLKWDIDGKSWPNRAASRFVDAGGLHWHVQMMGAGPRLLLLHGTAASTHSWRDVAPGLAQDFTVLAPDLPGHAFTHAPKRSHLSLRGMAKAVADLLAALSFEPEVVVGHSAGAAIALRMALDGTIAPRVIIGLNAAVMPFPGLFAVAFPALAKILFMNPIAARVAVRLAETPEAVDGLLRGTGSPLSAEGVNFYRKLFRNRIHVEAALGMMASWDLAPFRRDLPRLAVPLVLVTAANDLAVPPRTAEEVKRLVPSARIIGLPDLGHLAHEEDPAVVLGVIRSAVAAVPS